MGDQRSPQGLGERIHLSLRIESAGLVDDPEHIRRGYDLGNQGFADRLARLQCREPVDQISQHPLNPGRATRAARTSTGEISFAGQRMGVEDTFDEPGHIRFLQLFFELFGSRSPGIHLQLRVQEDQSQMEGIHLARRQSETAADVLDAYVLDKLKILGVAQKVRNIS